MIVPEAVMQWSLPRFAATLVAATVTMMVTVGGLAQVDIRTDLSTFLPQDDPVATQYQRLTETFGADPVVVMIESTSDRSLLASDPLQASVRLEGQLAQIDDVASVYGPGTLLNQIAGRAQDLLTELFGRRDAEIERARAAAKAAGASQSAAGAKARTAFDARYGPLLVEGLPSGLPTLGNQKFVERVVFDGNGDPRGQWKLVVPNRDTVAVLVRPRENLDADQTSLLVSKVRRTVAAAGLGEALAATKATKGDPDRLVTAKIAGASVIVSALSDRAVRDVPVLGALAVLTIGLCFLGATWIRRSRRLLPMATTLVSIILTVSVLGWIGQPLTVAVIAFLSVLLGIGCYYPTYLAMRASTRTFVTVVAASACSLGTLALSPLPLVRDLGFVLALGVALAGLVAWCARRLLVDDVLTGQAAVEQGAVGRPPRRRRVAACVVLAGLVATSVAGWVALDSVPLTTDVDDFASGLPELTEARSVETVLGSSGEVAIVIGGSDVMRPESLTWMRSALQTVVSENGDRMRPLVSAPALLEFLGDDPTAEEIDAAYRLLPTYLTHSIVSPDRSVSVMTFGVALDNLDSLRTVVDDVTRDLPPAADGDQTRVSGLPLVLLKAEDLVAADRYRANLLGIGAAGLVLLIGLRRRLDAVRGIASALLATGTGFALVSFTGGTLNPITGALGALTAAVGCEFTVMLAESARGRPLLRRAVLLVAATSAAGYAVLLASGLEAVQSFGLFLALGVALALVSSWAVMAATVGVTTTAQADDTTDAGEAPPATAIDRQEVLV